MPYSPKFATFRVPSTTTPTSSAGKRPGSLAFSNRPSPSLDLNLLEIEYNRCDGRKRIRRNSTSSSWSVRKKRPHPDDAGQQSSYHRRAATAEIAHKTTSTSQYCDSIFAGLGLGIAAAIGRGLLDRTVKTPEDVEREIGLAFLGLLPEMDGTATAGSYRRRKGNRPKRLANSIAN